MATQEERNAWATLERLKGKVDALIVQMESALASDPAPMSALRRRIQNAQKVWSEFEGQYDQLCAIAGENQVEQDRDEYTAFQSRYLEVHDRAEDALDNEQNAEEARLKELKDAEEACLQAESGAVHRQPEGSLPSHRQEAGRNQGRLRRRGHQQPGGTKGRGKLTDAGEGRPQGVKEPRKFDN